MYEIQVTVPEGRGKQVAQIALENGIKRATLTSVFVFGEGAKKDQITLEISTPEARNVTDCIMAAEWFDLQQCSLTIKQPRAIIGNTHRRQMTDPMVEPPLNLFEEIWQLNHITRSFVLRAFAAALIVTYGLAKDNLITIIIGLLFTPFLPQAMGFMFGAWASDWKLMRQGAATMLISIVASVVAGAFVGWMVDSPMMFTKFPHLLPGCLIASTIGLTAGVIQGDDAGRRFLVGVAAAAQVALFPTWFGWSLIHGFPDRHTTEIRIASFFINLSSTAVFALVGYMALAIKRHEVQRFVRFAE